MKPLADDGTLLSPLPQDADKVYPELSTSIFSDDTWVIDASKQKSTAPLIRLSFESVPSKTREFCKYFIWLVLNQETPTGELNRTHAIRSRISLQSVRALLSDVMPFLRWFEFRKEEEISHLTAEALGQYADTVSEMNISYNPRRRRLLAVSRIWLFSPFLLPQHKLIVPPWEKLDNLEDIIGASDWTPENKTEPIHPATMSPLLIWCQRLVNDFSDDIIEAITRYEALVENISKERPANASENVESYIKQTKATGQSVPASQIPISRSKKLGLATTSFQGFLGVPRNSSEKVRELDILADVAHTQFNFKPVGRIAGVPWTDPIKFYEVPRLKSLLLTASLVIVCYLSGMRGEEVRALRRGCCTASHRDGGTASFQIKGKTFKSAIDREGNLIPEGKLREVPWVVIGPVAQAIKVAELLHDHDLLFPSCAFRIRNFSKSTEHLSVNTEDIRLNIKRLIKWCNEQSNQFGRAHEIIPEDPAGAITVRRFRRTLAWFIYRRPGGRIALGVQYGHLHSYTTDGYGSRVSAGLKGLFPMEEAFSIADGLARATDAANKGTRVSGAAAERYQRGIKEFRESFSGKVLNAKQAAALMQNPMLRIYDNGPQLLACCYDPVKALCHPDKTGKSSIARSPDPTACDSRCANIARTDEHIQQIRKNVESLKYEIEAETLPLPLRERLKQRSASLEQLLTEHDAKGTSI